MYFHPDSQEIIANLNGIAYASHTERVENHNPRQANNDKKVNKKVTSDSLKTVDSDYPSTREVCQTQSRSSLQTSSPIWSVSLFKDADDLRKSYINSLVSHRVLRQRSPEKTLNNIIIFDWDDTLLCTSDLLDSNGKIKENIVFTDDEQRQMDKLQKYVYNILEFSVSRGDTYIITNAEPNWVEASSEKFYPGILELLPKITIISARGKYMSQYPQDIWMWKRKTFLDIVEQYNTKRLTNIVCSGDSFAEIWAGKEMAKHFEHVYIKTIWLKHQPKMWELVMQWSLLHKKFEYIWNTVKNWTIRLEKKKYKK